MDLRLLIVDDEQPARVRMRVLLGDLIQQLPHQIIGEAENAEAALALCTEYQPDVVLLDINMPGINGLELARHLRPTHSVDLRPWIIFVTAYDEYAVPAFEVNAIDYLLKPVRANRLLEALQRVQQIQQHQEKDNSNATQNLSALTPVRQHISIHERGRVLLVPVAEILYFKAELKYITVRTATREYLTEESLVTFEHEFSQQFVRIHRNALIAKDAIAGFERVSGEVTNDEETRSTEPYWEVILKGIGERLPISRRQWPLVKGLVKK